MAKQVFTALGAITGGLAGMAGGPVGIIAGATAGSAIGASLAPEEVKQSSYTTNNTLNIQSNTYNTNIHSHTEIQKCLPQSDSPVANADSNSTVQNNQEKKSIEYPRKVKVNRRTDSNVSSERPYTKNPYKQHYKELEPSYEKLGKDITPKTATATTYKILQFGDFVLPQHKEWQEETIQTATNIKELISAATTRQAISIDQDEAFELVEAAKYAKWETVLEIVNRKPYLINIIPVNKAWSTLQQAVYYKNIEVIQKLIAIDCCDVQIKAKRDRLREAKPGMTPIDYAEDRYTEFDEVYKILKEHLEKQKAVSGPTYIPHDKGEEFYKYGAPFFLISFAFINPFEVCGLNMQNMSNMQQLTEQVFCMIDSNWDQYMIAIAESLYPFDAELFKMFIDINDKDMFYSQLIRIYTYDYVYYEVNDAMRRASASVPPSGDDMLLSLYCLSLQAVLVHWSKLQPVSQVTYRGMKLCRQDLQRYQLGTKFFWFSFVSTSDQVQVAEMFARLSKLEDAQKTIFVMHTSGKGKLKPVSIKHLSNLPGESEILYPAGAEYEVFNIENINDCCRIHLKLLNTS